MVSSLLAPEVDHDLDRDRLIESHVPLVGHLVRRTLARLPRHVNADDLTSAAMTALVLGARSFDPERGVPFDRYVTIRINGALADELRAMDWTARSSRTAGRNLDAVHDQLSGALGRNPSVEELAAATGMTVDRIRTVQHDTHRAHTLSLDGFAGEDGIVVRDSPESEPESLLVRREELAYLRDAIAELPDRLRYVISQHFFEQRAMQDIAADLGVTPSRVSQLCRDALRLLHGAVQEHSGARTVDAKGRAAEAPPEYLAAVASRSTLAERLAMSTPTGQLSPVTAQRTTGPARRRAPRTQYPISRPA